MTATARQAPQRPRCHCYVLTPFRLMFRRTGRAIYLDAQATTPLDPRALDAMLPHMTHGYGMFCPLPGSFPLVTALGSYHACWLVNLACLLR